MSPHLLTQPPARETAASLIVSMRVAATAVVRAAAAGHDAMTSAVRALGAFDYDADAQRRDVAQLDTGVLAAELGRLPGVVSRPGREQLLTTLVAIAGAGGNAQAARPILVEAGRALALDPDDIERLLRRLPA